MLTDLHTWGVLPLALPVADANQVRSGQAGNPDSPWCTPNGVDLFIYFIYGHVGSKDGSSVSKLLLASFKSSAVSAATGRPTQIPSTQAHEVWMAKTAIMWLISSFSITVIERIRPYMSGVSITVIS